MAESQSGDVQADSEEQSESVPWTNQTPDTAIKGTFADLIPGYSLDGQTEDIGTDFGVVLDGIETYGRGTVFVNQEKPDGGTTADAFESARPTDYRVLDESNVDLLDGLFQSNEEQGSVYERADDVDERVLLWQGGLAGQYIGRTFDRHGTPWGRFAQDGYVVKGLLQIPLGWRYADNLPDDISVNDPDDVGERRAALASEGRVPRPWRRPYPRPDLQGEEVIITVRQSNGRSYLGNVFRADEAPEPDSFWSGTDIAEDSWEAAIDPAYDEDFDQFAEANDVWFAPYTGVGWQDEPENPQYPGLDNGGSSSTSSSLSPDNTDASDSDDSSGNFPSEAELADEIAQSMRDSGCQGLSPGGQDGKDGAWDGGIEAPIDQIHDDPSQVDVEEVRRGVYERLPWLDEDDL